MKHGDLPRKTGGSQQPYNHRRQNLNQPFGCTVRPLRPHALEKKFKQSPATEPRISVGSTRKEEQAAGGRGSDEDEDGDSSDDT